MFARVAELVDASVSKTDEVTLVPVRSRPRVRETSVNHLIGRGFIFCWMCERYQIILISDHSIPFTNFVTVIGEPQNTSDGTFGNFFI